MSRDGDRAAEGRLSHYLMADVARVFLADSRGGPESNDQEQTAPAGITAIRCEHQCVRVDKSVSRNELRGASLENARRMQEVLEGRPDRRPFPLLYHTCGGGRVPINTARTVGGIPGWCHCCRRPRSDLISERLRVYSHGDAGRCCGDRR